MYLFLATCQIYNLATTSTPSTYFWKKKSLLPHYPSYILFFSVLSQTCVPVCLCVFVLFNILQRHFKLKQENIYNSPTFLPRLFSASTSGRRRLHLSGSYWPCIISIYYRSPPAQSTVILLFYFPLFQCKKDERIFQSDLTWIIPSFSSSLMLLLARK